MSFADGFTRIALAVLCAAPPVRIAEVFYDAVGDDRGHEFVELVNVGPLPVPLAGTRLEAGDGSGPGRWSVRWIAAAADTIAPFGRFVVGGEQVAEANARASLELQNGPDAVRLVAPGGASETVGYGALEWDEYFCGAPAAGVAPGQSVARVPDASDLGSNALDFRASPPTSGRPNQARRNLGWVPGTLSATPEQPAPGTPFRLSGLVHNSGAELVAPSSASIAVTSAGAARGEAVIGLAFEPGDTLRVEAPVAGLDAGRRELRASLRLDGDEAALDDADSVVIRVGRCELELTEIQFHPAAGEGEWVEVRNLAGASLRIESFRMSDRGATRGVPAPGELAPGAYGVLAQDAAALRARFPAADSLRIWATRPWPTLNNSDDAAGIADAVVLRDADGTPCARHDYGARGVPAGVPLERDADGNWQPALDPGGTPLGPPRPRPDVPGRFRLSRPRVAVADGRQRCAWSLPWARARVGLDVYDLSGRHVARVASEREASGRGELEWDAGALGPGLYLVVLRARPVGGDERMSLTRALRVEGAP